MAAVEAVAVVEVHRPLGHDARLRRDSRCEGRRRHVVGRVDAHPAHGRDAHADLDGASRVALEDDRRAGGAGCGVGQEHVGLEAGPGVALGEGPRGRQLGDAHGRRTSGDAVEVEVLHPLRHDGDVRRHGHAAVTGGEEVLHVHGRPRPRAHGERAVGVGSEDLHGDGRRRVGRVVEDDVLVEVGPRVALGEVPPGARGGGAERHACERRQVGGRRRRQKTDERHQHGRRGLPPHGRKIPTVRPSNNDLTTAGGGVSVGSTAGA